MVRQLLGNIKGPKGDTGLKGDIGPRGAKGDKGDKGDTGEFKNDAIGVINLVDFSKPQSLDSANTWEFDKETGIVNYNLTSNQFISFEVHLQPRVHTFRIEDFTPNDTFSGQFRFQVRDSNREYIHAVNVPKKGHFTFDLTSYGVAEKFEIYIHRGAGSGFIEKPMLVEGDYSVLWNQPEKPGVEYISALLRGEITGLQAEPSFASITGATTGSTQSVNSNNEIVLTEGVWVVSINAYLSPIDYDSYVNIGIYHNDSQIVLWQKGSQSSKDFSGNQIVKVNEGDRVSVRAYKPSSGGTLSFGATSSNKINVYKISK